MVKLEPAVFLFVGDENYLKEKAIRELSSSLLDGSSKELDYKVFYGGETGAREILSFAATIPFLAAQKLVVIKDFEELSEEDKTRLIAYIKNPAKHTCLVLDIASASSLKDFHSVSRYIKVSRFDDLNDSELRPWIKDFLASRDKIIEEDAMEVLKELQGSDLSRLAQELEKLSLYAGKDNLIKKSDVQDIVGESVEKPIFDLARAISEKRADAALKIVSNLTLAGRRVPEIVGFLYWHLKRLLKAKLLQAKGERDSSIGDILKINRRYLDGFFKQARSCGLSQIKSKIRVLLEADLDIKRTRLDPAVLLEFVIIRLCLD